MVTGSISEKIAAQVAALEGELRYLQRDYADPSVIPLQYAKAFECQLLSILEPFLKPYEIFFKSR